MTLREYWHYASKFMVLLIGINVVLTLLHIFLWGSPLWLILFTLGAAILISVLEILTAPQRKEIEELTARMNILRAKFYEDLERINKE